jgi:hypothetical protein
MVAQSDVAPAVSCSSEHVYETYAVVPVPASIARFAQRPQYELLSAVAHGLCPLDPIRPYLGADPLDSQWSVSVWTKFPTPSEWRHHVRVVVCDLAVDAPPGVVPVHDFSLHNIMHFTKSARVRVCRVGTPLEYVTCDRPHVGEKTGQFTIAGSPTAPAAPAAFVAGCTRNALSYLQRTSLPAGFHMEYVAGSSPTADCWLTRDRGTSSGTLRAGLVNQ